MIRSILIKYWQDYGPEHLYRQALYTRLGHRLKIMLQFTARQIRAIGPDEDMKQYERFLDLKGIEFKNEWN